MKVLQSSTKMYIANGRALFEVMEIRIVADFEYGFLADISLKHEPTNRFYLHKVFIDKRMLHNQVLEETPDNFFEYYKPDIYHSIHALSV